MNSSCERSNQAACVLIRVALASKQANCGCANTILGMLMYLCPSEARICICIWFYGM